MNKTMKTHELLVKSTTPKKGQDQVITREEAIQLTDKIRTAGNDIAEMLYEAHSKRIWEPLKYTSWKSYIKGEFQMSEQRSFQLLSFVEIKNVLNDSTMVESVPDKTTVEPQSEAPISDLPKTERQTRPLTKLKEPEQQRQAWKAAVASSPNGQPTARQVQVAVNKVIEQEAPPPPPPPTKRPKVYIDVAMDYANIAIRQLHSIQKNDVSRAAAFNKVIAFCEEQLKK